MKNANFFSEFFLNFFMFISEKNKNSTLKKSFQCYITEII